MQCSYQFEDLEGRQTEAMHLAERAQLRLEGFIELLARHEFPPQGRILEVGCGQAIRTKLMAEHHPEARIVGLDRSPELLQAAQSSLAGLSQVDLVEGDLYDLDFAEASFDFVYARLVFMHLCDPLRALASLQRILRPGGRILIEDADRDCMFFEPRPPSFPSFWQKVQEGQSRAGGDPNVGRRLAPYLKEANFTDVRIEAQPIIGDGRDIAFLTRTLMPSLNHYLEPEDRAGGALAINDLAMLALDPRATFYHLWFAVSGTKREP